MSLFSRIGGFLRSVFSDDSADVDTREIIDEELAEHDILEDELADIWQNTVEENIGDLDEIKDFAIDNRGAELFATGWIDSEASHEDRVLAREEFFELMSPYGIDDASFDWDAWRDWYGEG